MYLGPSVWFVATGHDDQWPRIIEIKVVVRLGIE